ncbi:MAG: hypothetical protein LAT55_05340 [Opitutales bacterium]|nr:hypothetical protein [Opitutales bacterium]
MSDLTITETTFEGWKSLQLQTGRFVVTAPLEVGPRFMEFRRPDGKNLFYQFPGQQGGKNEEDHQLRGGHRLWHSPEHEVRTYQPDNTAVSVDHGARGFRLQGPLEEKTGMEKSLGVEVLGNDTLKIEHSLTNHGMWPVPCAAWPLTMLRRGGVGVVPFFPKGEHPRDLLPNMAMVPWTYTDLSAPCWKFRSSYLAIDTAVAETPQKLGFTNYPGWSAYWLNGDTFVKYAVPPKANETYPDLGCCFETFCNDSLIELETLSPLVSLGPQETIRHDEYWTLIPGLPSPLEEKDYLEGLFPAVSQWLKNLPQND